MKVNWKKTLKTIGKVAAVGAGGAVLQNQDVQQLIVAAVPPPWNIGVGMAFGFLVMQLKPVGKTAEPTVTELSK